MLFPSLPFLLQLPLELKPLAAMLAILPENPFLFQPLGYTHPLSALQVDQGWQVVPVQWIVSELDKGEAGEIRASGAIFQTLFHHTTLVYSTIRVTVLGGAISALTATAMAIPSRIGDVIRADGTVKTAGSSQVDVLKDSHGEVPPCKKSVSDLPGFPLIL